MRLVKLQRRGSRSWTYSFHARLTVVEAAGGRRSQLVSAVLRLLGGDVKGLSGTIEHGGMPLAIDAEVASQLRLGRGVEVCVGKHELPLAHADPTEPVASSGEEEASTRGRSARERTGALRVQVATLEAELDAFDDLVREAQPMLEQEAEQKAAASQRASSRVERATEREISTVEHALRRVMAADDWIRAERRVQDARTTMVLSARRVLAAEDRATIEENHERVLEAHGGWGKKSKARAEEAAAIEAANLARFGFTSYTDYVIRGSTPVIDPLLNDELEAAETEYEAACQRLDELNAVGDGDDAQERQTVRSTRDDATHDRASAAREWLATQLATAGVPRKGDVVESARNWLALQESVEDEIEQPAATPLPQPSDACADRAALMREYVTQLLALAHATCEWIEHTRTDIVGVPAPQSRRTTLFDQDALDGAGRPGRPLEVALRSKTPAHTRHLCSAEELDGIKAFLARRITELDGVCSLGSVPLVLEDSLAGLASESAIAILEWLESRRGPGAQVIVCSDDHDVLEWARRRRVLGVPERDAQVGEVA